MSVEKIKGQYAVVDNDWAIRLPDGWVYTTDQSETRGRPMIALSGACYRQSGTITPYGDNCFTVFNKAETNGRNIFTLSLLNNGEGVITSRDGLRVTYNCNHNENTTYCQYVIVTTYAAVYTIQFFYTDKKLGEAGRVKKIEEILKTICLVSEIPATPTPSEEEKPKSSKTTSKKTAKSAVLKNKLTYSKRKSIKHGPLTFALPDGYVWFDGEGVNAKWSCIVPEGTDSSSNHIDASPFGIAVTTDYVNITSIDESNVDGMEMFLKLHGDLDPSVDVNRVVLDWDCTYLYQIWHDLNDPTYNKINGFLLTTAGVYQFHAFYNHGGQEDAYDVSIEYGFAEVVEKWMKKTSCEKALAYQNTDYERVSIGDKTVVFFSSGDTKVDSSVKLEADRNEARSSEFSDPSYVRLTMDDILSANGMAISYEGSETKIILPDGITEIGSNFETAVELEGVVVPEGVTEIKDSAFYLNDKLKTVVLPSTLEKIGESAFEGCLLLESIELPDGLTEIEESAFSSCDSLKMVTIPSTVECIGDNVFDNCAHITDVYLLGDIENISDSSFFGMSDNVLFHIPSGSDLEDYCKENFLKYDFDDVGEYVPREERAVSERSDVSDFVIKNGLLKKYDGCAKVVEIPEGVKEIYLMVFSHHHEIEKVIVPEGVQKIDGSAFSYCLSLSEIVLPTTLRVVDGAAFSECVSLKRVSFAPGIETLGSSIFSRRTKDVYLPATVKSIEKYAFFAGDGVKLHVPEGSVAEEYAKENDIEYDNESDSSMQQYVEFVAEEKRKKEEAARKAREEAARKAREKEERKAREEAERKAREEEERRLQEEALRKAREEEERIAREKAERIAREEAERKAREEAALRALEEMRADRRKRNVCQQCGGSFKGLFTKKCSSCGMKKDY